MALSVLTLSGGLGLWSIAYADVPVPERFRRERVPESVILIEIAEEGDNVTLVLPR